MIWPLFALLVLASAADVATTIRGLGRGATETNPLARMFFARLGPVAGAIVLKLLGVAVFLGIALLAPHHIAAIVITGIAAVASTGIAVRNWLIA